MKRCASSDRPTDLPDWYWTKGLHDARFTLTEALELPYDYRLRNPHRNCLKLHLDAVGALYETGVRCITLYDYSLLSGELPQTGGWWMSDALRREGRGYVLEAEWTDNQDLYSFAIRFEDAEVERR